MDATLLVWAERAALRLQGRRPHEHRRSAAHLRASQIDREERLRPAAERMAGHLEALADAWRDPDR